MVTLSFSLIFNIMMYFRWHGNVFCRHKSMRFMDFSLTQWALQNSLTTVSGCFRGSQLSLNPVSVKEKLHFIILIQNGSTCSPTSAAHSSAANSGMLLSASSAEWFENGEEYRGHWIQQHLLCHTLQHGTDAHYSTLLCLILNGARDGISCCICYCPAKEPDTSVRDYIQQHVWELLSASFQVINIHFQRLLKRWEWEIRSL